MCIAVHKPEGIVILDKVINNCFNNNNDGAGFAYMQDNKIVIEKGFFTLKEFEEAYAPHKEKECLLHFRIKTHGDLSKEMCHPFEINDHIAMVHNGIISGHGWKDKSDTYEFVEEIIKPMVQAYGDAILGDPVFQKIIDKYIGASKLMFLNAETKEHHIINELACNVADKITFSNLSWQDRPVVVYNKQNNFNDDLYGGTGTHFNNRRFAKKEVKKLTNYANLEMTKDDFYKLKYDIMGKGQKGDIVIIEKLYDDYTVDVCNLSANMPVEGLGVYSLDKADEHELCVH